MATSNLPHCAHTGDCSFRGLIDGSLRCLLANVVSCSCSTDGTVTIDVGACEHAPNNTGRELVSIDCSNMTVIGGGCDPCNCGQPCL